MRFRPWFFVLCLGWCPAAVRADAPAAETPKAATTPLLPAGFGNVRLGMTMGQLLASRPNVVSLDLFDSGPPVTPQTKDRDLLENNPVDTTFQSATYTVHGGHLTALMVSGRVSLVDLPRVSQAVTSEALSLYGVPDSIRTALRSQEDGMVNSAVLVWKVGGSCVAVLYPTVVEGAKVKSGSVEELFDTETPPQVTTFRCPKISREQDDKIWQRVLAQVEHALPGKSQSVRRIYSDTATVMPPLPYPAPIAKANSKPKAKRRVARSLAR